MGTWGETERVVQPTDPSVWSVFVSKGRGNRKEDEREAGKDPQGLLVRRLTMKARLVRLAITLSAIAATALAGGATLKGF